MIRAPKGFELLAFDLSQAESWVVAYLADEHNMKHALQFGDIHSSTAVAIFHEDYSLCQHAPWKTLEDSSKQCELCNVLVTKPERYSGKKTNHSSSYGVTPPQMMKAINAESDKPPYVTVTLKDTKRYSEAWHKLYNVKSWWDQVQRELSLTRTLVNPYDRVRVFFAAWGNELFKEAYAFIPQSTVADHFNGAVQKELGIVGGVKALYHNHAKKGYYDIINHSHDSVLLKVPTPVRDDLIHEIKNYLQRPLVINGEQFTIPVDGERGERYGELEEIKL